MKRGVNRHSGGLAALLASLSLLACRPGHAGGEAGVQAWLDGGRAGASSPVSACNERDGCFPTPQRFPLLYLQLISERAVVLGFARQAEADAWTAESIALRTVPTDPKHVPARVPVEGVGRSRSVVGFTASAEPLVERRVFLLLGQALQEGAHYTLHVPGLRGGPIVFLHTTGRRSPAVQVDQVGYLPKARKRGYAGYWLGDLGALPLSGLPFEVVDTHAGTVVHSGTLQVAARPDPWSGHQVGVADFSTLQNPGSYRLRIPGLGGSAAFEIGSSVYEHVFRRLFKAFYYQRNSTPISTPWADAGYARPGGIPPDMAARIHPAVAASTLSNGEIPESARELARGWFDAGDYGQYVVNAAPVWYAFALGFDLLPNAMRSDALGIPESGNGQPDVLDELDWGMDWLLGMQDSDGGVYSRLAPKRWDASLPHAVTEPRYLFEKTTHATATFAAMTAIHARLLQTGKPDRASRSLAAARAAWAFLQAHRQWPAEGQRYRNPPGVSAGEYADASALDNRLWAAAELFRTTREPAFLEAALELLGQFDVDPTRGVNFERQGLAGYWALLAMCPDLAEPDLGVCNRLRSAVIGGADWHLRVAADNPWGAPLHPHPPYLGWGTFARSSRAVLPLLQAWKLTGDRRYLEGAADSVHPQLGANPQSLSYITSVGRRWPRFPLSKLSQYDALAEPLPGIPVHGPSFHLPPIWPATRAVNQAYYPPEGEGPDTYPPLLRYVDSDLLPPMSEPTVAELAEACVAFALVSGLPGVQQPSD